VVTDIHLALAFDTGALVGAHLTMRSILEHLSPTARANFHCYGPPLPASDIACLRSTLDSSGRDYNIEFIDVSPSRFASMKWQGGFATYLRLIIPALCEVERIIYLDSDLLVFTDLSHLFAWPLEECVLGAVSWHDGSVSNDQRFFRKLQMDSGEPYFNAGVLLVNAPRWKEENFTERCLQLGDRYGKALPTADQTILNIVFHGSFCSLPRKFNTPVVPGRASLACEVYQDRVIHLVSHPKPWDPFGFLNGQYALFRQELEKTALGPYSSTLTLKKCRRVLRWSAGYLKCLSRRLRRD